MRFGLGPLTVQHHPADTRSDAELYEETIELAVEAERLGFDSVWVSEHHFTDDGWNPAVLPLAAAIAARTSRITVATGLALAPLYHPLRLAEDAAVVDLIAQGRFLLGLGQGWREEEFDAFGASLAERPRTLRRTVSLLRRAWAGEAVAADDGAAAVHVRPLPAQAGGPPIWVGASSEPGMRRAARIGDGFIASRQPPERYRDIAGWLREELDRAGRDPAGFGFAVHSYTFAAPGDAWGRVRDLCNYLEWKYRDLQAARGRPGPSSLPPPLDPAAEDAMRAATVVGTPAEVVERLAGYEAAAGPDFHYVARLHWPGMEPAAMREAMAVFAEEVAPHLR